MSVRSGTINAEDKESMKQWMDDVQTRYGSYDPGEYGEKKKRRSIYRWPNDLVAASSLSRHRAPIIVSLGPYHHGKEHLQPMEHHKERALHKILHRSKIHLSSFIQSLQDVGQELWDSYDNLDLNLSPHSFLGMMLFDGCFLLEILRSENNNDPLFGPDEWSPLYGWVALDMLRLENQIRLLVLEKLLAVEAGSTMNIREYLHDLVPKFFGFTFPFEGPCLHILDIYRECFIADCTARGEKETPISVCSHFEPWLHLAGKGLKRMLIAIPILVFWLLRGRTPKHEHFRTASSLHEAGIKFKVGRGVSGLTITFDEKNGVLTLPYFELHEVFTLICVNFIAFERLHPRLSGNKWMTDYMFLLDKLIDTAEDVGVLCSQGILSNQLASDEDAAKVINALSDALTFNNMDTEELIKKWQDYASSDWNLALASLKHKYFHNPWSVVSLFAALILLALTIIQTVFSGMQALNGGK